MRLTSSETSTECHFQYAVSQRLAIEQFTPTILVCGCGAAQIRDQFGFSFLKELLAQRGISVSQRPFTSRSKPEILLDLKLGLAQGRVSLLDHAESLRELRMLESRRTSGGNYSIAAPRGAHDDYAIVISLLCYEMKSGSSSPGFLLVQRDARGPVETVSSGAPRPDWQNPRFYGGKSR
jgi:hypothetical protein